MKEMRSGIYQHFASALGVASAWGICSATIAQETDFEIGIRPMILGSRGEPANDMLGGGLVVGWRWRDDWYFGLGLDSMAFDYERPHKALEIQQDPDIKTLDGSNSFTRVAGWAERRYTRGGPWSWFWNAGLGVASIDADVVAGPTKSGGTFDIVTDASDEIHLMSSIGLRRSLGENWALAGTFHLEHHLTDYKITDTVSGVTGKIGAHSPIGASVTLSYRF